MSEKRTSISIYLTPRAAAILRDYNEGSGYGSISRTVEEIILAFDAVFRNVTALNQIAQNIGIQWDTATEKERTGALFLALYTVLLNIQNATSRLNLTQSSAVLNE